MRQTAQEERDEQAIKDALNADKRLLLEALLRERESTAANPMMHFAQWNFLPTWTNDHARKIAAIKALIDDGTIIDIIKPGAVILREELLLEEITGADKGG